MKLGDELIVPNVDQDISFSYDPSAKKLRRRFELYPEGLHATVEFAHDLDRRHTELLKRIQSERHQRKRLDRQLAALLSSPPEIAVHPLFRLLLCI